MPYYKLQNFDAMKLTARCDSCSKLNPFYVRFISANPEWPKCGRCFPTAEACLSGWLPAPSLSSRCDPRYLPSPQDDSQER